MSNENFRYLKHVCVIIICLMLLFGHLAMLFYFYGNYAASSRPVSNINVNQCTQNADTSCKSHTSMVVRECFKGNEASQWKRPKFDPSPHQNPLTDLHKNWQA